MNVKSKEVQLFENITQLECDEAYYDFHNDFNCIQLLFEDSKFSLLFKHFELNICVEMIFFNVVLVKIGVNCDNKEVFLTIDNLYRGRFEKDKKLYEFSDDGNSYFYLEFYEEQCFEFFSDEFSIKEIIC